MGNKLVQPKATELRERFRAIPAETREANQKFCIRVWRALSWLERSEGVDDGDLEGAFIPLWIAFNALYGHIDDDGTIAPDRASWQGFLAAVAKADGSDRLGKALWDEQLDVLRMVDSRYLFKPFWLDEHAETADRLKRARQRAIQNFQDRSVVGVMQEVFERIYVLRQQVFHGAATCGSKFNRNTLKMGVHVLAAVIPVMIEIVLDAGPEIDWGEVCFPPVP